MPYEDKFKSVREHGPRPGTEPELVAPSPEKDTPTRDAVSILSDLEKMIVDDDDLFTDYPDDQYVALLLKLINDAKEALRG